METYHFKLTGKFMGAEPGLAGEPASRPYERSAEGWSHGRSALCLEAQSTATQIKGREDVL